MANTDNKQTRSRGNPIKEIEIGSFNLEYGNLENDNLESRDGYLEFNLKNGIIASPIINPYLPHSTPTHTHPKPPGRSGGPRVFSRKYSRLPFSRKAVSRFEKSAFEINYFFRNLV